LLSSYLLSSFPDDDTTHVQHLTNMSTARAYFSHFSPSAIFTTLSTSSQKFKAHYNIPSLNPLYYIDPRTLRPWLSDPANLRNLLRLVVIVVVYLLFRTKLAGWLRGASGAPMTREEELVQRVGERERERRWEEGRKVK
jgi:hypothetical protein